eukprot:COSAG05_NODE_361_length_10793_cov_141.983262_12_plen_123_part_00
MQPLAASSSFGSVRYSTVVVAVAQVTFSMAVLRFMPPPTRGGQTAMPQPAGTASTCFCLLAKYLSACNCVQLSEYVPLECPSYMLGASSIEIYKGGGGKAYSSTAETASIMSVTSAVAARRP